MTEEKKLSVKQLKELLSNYDDDCKIWFCDNEYKDITELVEISMVVEQQQDKTVVPTLRIRIE